MGMRFSGKIAFIVSRITIDEAYLAFIQGETADDLIFGLLNFLLSLMELCLGCSPFLNSGERFFILRVKIDSW
jgi:hypothetical protein